nr:GGDEF domain-containing phosphodiesterase [Pleionea sp. CnH1-48]
MIAHNQLKESEERLQLALQGKESGLWDWSAATNLFFEPRLVHEVDDKDSIDFHDRLSSIHEDDKETYLDTWSQLITGNITTFDHIYRIRDKQGSWLWFRDVAKVTTKDENGNPLRVTGTYTDISANKEARDKVILFSKAFENSRDIICILDQKKQVIAVNPSFYQSTQHTDKDIIGKGVFFLRQEQGSNDFVDALFKSIENEKHWEGEGYMQKKYQPPFPVLIKANLFIAHDSSPHYVFTITDISAQKAAEEELRKLASYDPLTNLPNRTLLTDRIHHAIAHCKRKNNKLCIFFIDLDRFKQINDSLGHDIGDLLLIHVAKILTSSIRANDTAARLGGDEFVIVLEEISNLDAANRIAQQIIDNMSQPINIKNNEIITSPSIGISTYPDDGDDVDTLLKHADIAMYHAKSAGRNNFQYYQPEMNEKAHDKLQLEGELRRAIKQNEFTLHYQPQVSISTNKVIGFEALARWQKKDGTWVPPCDFIHIAEEMGLIIPLTEQLMEQAFSLLSSWHKAGLNLGMAINLSAKHLSHHDILGFINELLEKYPVDCRQVEFELTESVLMEDIDSAWQLFKDLSERGIDLALDDFGTGYSSLKYLHQLPIKKLKIDRSFINQIGVQKQSEAIIESTIALAQSLNLKTVAEGIETKEQLAFINSLNVDLAQGYYFSKPLSIEALPDYLEKNY